jgi:hypothetical protein
MSKNIDNRNKVATGISVSSTDSVPEGSQNLYHTDLRVNTLIEGHPDYKNAESLFLAPISGPGLFGGQIMNYDGAVWQVSSNLRLNNGNIVTTGGDYAFPAATKISFGPFALAKAAGTAPVLTIGVSVTGSAGYAELFITARDTVTAALYQDSLGFFYQNIAGVVTITEISGFYSAEYTHVVVGTDVIVRLNTVNIADTSISGNLQTVSGGVPTLA